MRFAALTPAATHRLLLATVVVSILLLAGVPAAAQGRSYGSDSPEQAAEKVLAAFVERDAAALKTLADRDKPDPWLVADALLFRGWHDAAEAFAKAALRVGVEGLPAYVASARGEAPDEIARAALQAVYDALGKRDGQKALTAAEGVPASSNSVVRISVRFGQGLALQSLGRYGESYRVLMAAGWSALRIGWKARAAAAFNEAAQSARSLADWKSAVRALKARLSIERALNNRSGVADAQNRLGIALRYLGKLPEALQALDESLEISRERGDQARIAMVLLNTGTVRKLLGDYAQALELYRQALKISRARGSQLGVANGLNNLGNIQKRLGNYPEAVAAYQEAMGYWDLLGNETGLAATLNNYGNALERLGNYSAALLSYEKSLKISRQRRNRPAVATTLNNIGILQVRLGHHQAALRSHEEALEICCALDNRARTIEVLGCLGSLLKSLGRYEESRKCLEESLELARARGDRRGISGALNDLGTLDRALGNHAEALRRYREALKICREMGNEYGIGSALLNIGGLQQILGNFDEAREAYEEVRRVVEDSPAREQLASVCWGLAKLSLRGKEYGQAVAFARQGIEHALAMSGRLSVGEGAGAREWYSGLFNIGYRAALRAGQVEQLLWLLEQGRAGSLREALGSRSALEAAVIPRDMRQELALARHGERRALAALNKAQNSGKLARIRSARKAWEDSRTAVGEVAARIQRVAKATTLVALKEPAVQGDIQGYLQSGEALVLYGLTREEALALVVTEKSVRMVALPPSREIAAAAAELLSGELRVDPEKADALCGLLVEPLELPDEIRRVLVSPAGRMAYVPFALLLPGREVVYVPSGTTYGLLTAERKKHGTGVLGLGDPDYGERTETGSGAAHGGAKAPRLASLPGSRDEVKAVADVAAYGKDASESGLQRLIRERDRWRAVHFACHGLLDPDRPMFSSLALTPDTENDGFLTALEVFRMSIPADLVVLSACETGRGKVYMTEGIVGLARAFMFAGAPRVLCSLWEVDDEATRALMVKFYELWNPKEGDGLPAAAALKQAQEYVRSHEQWMHPHYWAAWVLWGLPD